MSKTKVDLSVFEELAELAEGDYELSDIIWQLASGDLDFETPKNFDEVYEWVEGDTGGEGQGEACYGVFKLKDKIYKAEWSYYSYHGCDYDDIEHTLKEVVAKEKLVTVYE